MSRLGELLHVRRYHLLPTVVRIVLAATPGGCNRERPLLGRKQVKQVVGLWLFRARGMVGGGARRHQPGDRAAGTIFHPGFIVRCRHRVPRRAFVAGTICGAGYFLDTNALAKLYHEEVGSQYVERLLVSPEQNVRRLPLVAGRDGIGACDQGADR